MSEVESTICESLPSSATIEPRLSGVMLRVDAGATMPTEFATARLHEQAYDALHAGFALSVHVDDLGCDQSAPDAFGRVCNVLRAAMDEASAGAGDITVSLAAGALPPNVAWRTRCETLGPGPAYLLAGHSLLRPHDRHRKNGLHDQFWSQLWQLRNEGWLRTAYAPVISSPCPLLGDESADAIEPTVGMQVPAGSAWISMQLDLLCFSDSCGVLDEPALEVTLADCVDRGDAMHDIAAWPTTQMQRDACRNRRLAICISGVGDLVLRRRADPRRFACLRETSDLLSWCRSTVHARSRQIARDRGSLPALSESDPVRLLPTAKARDAWCDRWQQAVDISAVGHRNLLVMSPWSVFPSLGGADFAYLDLLPLLEFADAGAFGRPPLLNDWNVNKFKGLHHRTSAVFERKGAQGQIAEQV